MANKITIDIEVNGKMQKATVDAQKLGSALKDTGNNARHADRNLKGAAQASANGSKNFSKLAQGMTGSLVPAYAAVAAQVFALTAMFNVLKNAADFANLQAAQQSYAQSTGMAMQSITKQIKSASGEMLGFKEAAEAAAIGAAKGFTTNQMTSLAEGAGKAAAALGRNYQDAFDRLLRGVSKAEPELLDELGITLRLETATKNYATAIGTTADKLTAAQRSQAVYVETMNQLNKNFGQVEQAVNPFQQLLVTFTELGQTLMQTVLPPLEALANFLNKNAEAATVAFTALIAMVLMNMPIIGEKIKSVFGKAGDGAKQFGRRIFVPLKRQSKLATRSIRDNLDAQIKKLEEVEIAAKNASEKQADTTKASAQGLLNSGVKSKSITRVANNPLSLSPQQKGKLMKDIDDYIKKVKEGGDVSKSVFAGTTVEALEDFQGELRKTEKPVISLADKIKKKLGKGAQRTIRSTGTLLRGMGKAARGAGAAFKFLGKATIVIGILSALADVLNDLITRPAALVNSMISMFVKIGKGVQLMGNFLISVINKLLEQIPETALSFAGLSKEDIKIGKLDFADGLEGKLTSAANAALNLAGIVGGDGQTPLEKLAETDAANVKLEAYNQKIDNLKTNIVETGAEAAKLAEAIGAAMEKGIKSNIDIVGMKANALATLPIASMLQSVENSVAGKGQGVDRSSEVKASLQEAFKDVDISKFGSAFKKAFEAGNIEGIKEAAIAGAAFKAEVAGVRDIMGNLATTLNNDPLSNRDVARALLASAKAADAAAKEMGELTDVVGEADAAFVSGVDGYIKQVDRLIAKQRELAEEKTELQLDTIGTGRLASSFRQEEQYELNRRKARLDYETKLNELATANLNLEETKVAKDSAAYEQLLTQVQTAQNAVDIAKETRDVLEETTYFIDRVGLSIGDSFANSMATAFDGIVQGTLTAKEAFANMARSILQDIAKMITKMLALKLLESALGGTRFGDFLGVKDANGMTFADNEFLSIEPTQFRYGGITEGYSTGGIAKGPQSGYPVMMHGAEAIVPLPNGKSIPVHMKGAGQQNNVTVNVSVDNQGGTSQNKQSNSSEGNNLGTAIASAVQKELLNQKRPGGMLHKTGMA